MTNQEITTYNKQINNCIENGLLAEAMAKLSALLTNVGIYTLRVELDKLQETYRLMLNYFVEGYEDPHRIKMSEEIKGKLHKLNETTHYQALSKIESTDYFKIVRSREIAEKSIDKLINDIKLITDNISNISEAESYLQNIFEEMQASQKLLFNKVWTTQFLSKQDYDELNKLLIDSDDSSTIITIQSDILGALYLGCMQYYDPAKVKLLITTSLNNRSPIVLARAYTLLIILLSFYGERVAADRKLRSLLSLFIDNGEFIAAYKQVIIGFVKSIDTQKINRTIAEEIIPEIIKMRPDLERSLRKMENELDEEASDYNPAWEEILENTGLEEKLRQLSDLQMEGGDMFMLAFAKMKTMPFFRDEANWFIPFDTNRTEIHGIIDKMPEGFTGIIERNKMFCHSDRYSMFLGLNSMPEATMNMMTSQINDQMTQLDEERLASFDESSRPTIFDEIDLFLKDLYRFYHLSATKHEFRNPFSEDLNLADLPIVREYFNEEDDLLTIGTLYFKRNSWENAIKIFERLEEMNSDYISQIESYDTANLQFTDEYDQFESNIAKILEMKGYAQMQLKDYKSALQTFKQAQQYRTPSLWLLSEIAECYRSINDTDSYRNYLDKALEIDSNNKRILLKRGKCYMDDRMYDNAIKVFYKLNYLNPDNILYIRLLAWCRCLQGDAEKALKLYDSIPEEKRELSDTLNIGHCYFANGTYTRAVECYRKYIDRTDSEQFINVMKADADTLPFFKNMSDSFTWIREAALLGDLR